MERQNEKYENSVRKGKYAPLFGYLKEFKGEQCQMSFEELENILGFGLPNSARIHRPWWANQGRRGGHSHSLAWEMAGWRTSQVDMEGEKLVFISYRTNKELKSIKMDTSLDAHGVGIDFLTAADIRNSFSRIDALFESKIFHQDNFDNPLVESALMELLIRLRDLMAKSAKFVKPVEFSDDIIVTNSVKNVSEAIKFIRDAMCHIDSKNHNYRECNARLSYNVVYGKCNIIKIGNVEIKSEYDNDVCFFFGEQKLYLLRHIQRAYEEAKDNLEPILAVGMAKF